MAKKKDNKKKTKKIDYKKKYEKLKVKYKKLKIKTSKKPTKKSNKKKIIKVNSSLSESSTNYNVDNAIKKLRSLKNLDQINAFTKSEKRVTVTRVIDSLKKRITK